MKKNVGFFLALLLVLAALVLPHPHKAQAQAVAQSYTADSQLQPGMVVEPASDKTRVKPVPANEASKMLGIIVQPNDAPLSLAESDAGQRVYVATSGSYHLLVSDQEGEIKKGDYLVVSSIEGVGMKADDTSQYVIGKALNGFDGKSDVLSQTKVKDTRGDTRTVTFGYITADINISRNPLLRDSTPSSNLPSYLQKAAEAIASKPVQPLRVYLGFAVIVITAVIVCTILYAGIRTSIVSMGRNPLAKKSILRNLASVVLIALIILLTGTFAVYLLLKL